MIPYGRQCISEEDIAAVVRVLRSDFLTCGPEVEAFEREFAAYVGASYAVAVSNATTALHLAMLVLGIGKRDRVVTSPITFVASANAAAYVGAIPDFSDIEPDFCNLDPVTLEENWKPDTKAVVAVDYAGRPCQMPEIARIARERGAYVIEDACHGTGGGFFAEGNAWKLGGHPWADITVFSFHPVKTMTTGEGGILVTNNRVWAEKARLLRGHGITRNPEEFVGLTDSPLNLQSPIFDLQSSPPPSSISHLQSSTSSLLTHGSWYYEMQELGYNYRITDLQCALGRSQIARLPGMIRRRQEMVQRYNEAFSDLALVKIPKLEFSSDERGLNASSGFGYMLSDLSLHLYTIQIDFPCLGKTRTQVMQDLREVGIGTQVLYIPVHLQPWYRRNFGYGVGKCPIAEQFYAHALSLPLYPSMSDEDVEKVVGRVREIVA